MGDSGVPGPGHLTYQPGALAIVLGADHELAGDGLELQSQEDGLALETRERPRRLEGDR